jgi:hypothetical protein
VTAKSCTKHSTSLIPLRHPHGELDGFRKPHDIACTHTSSGNLISQIEGIKMRPERLAAKLQSKAITQVVRRSKIKLDVASRF